MVSFKSSALYALCILPSVINAQEGSLVTCPEDEGKMMHLEAATGDKYWWILSCSNIRDTSRDIAHSPEPQNNATACAQGCAQIVSCYAADWADNTCWYRGNQPDESVERPVRNRPPKLAPIIEISNSLGSETEIPDASPLSILRYKKNKNGEKAIKGENDENEVPYAVVYHWEAIPNLASSHTGRHTSLAGKDQKEFSCPDEKHKPFQIGSRHYSLTCGWKTEGTILTRDEITAAWGCAAMCNGNEYCQEANYQLSTNTCHMPPVDGTTHYYEERQKGGLDYITWSRIMKGYWEG